MSHRPLWAEINLQAVKNNMKIVKELADQAKIISVVKANAYGHGAVEIARAIYDDSDYFAVAITSEAIELREAGIEKDILIMGWIPSEDFALCLEKDIILTIYDYEEALLLNDQARVLGKKARVHLKIDTGMGRLGLLPNEKGLAQGVKIMQLENIIIEGVFSHFSKADEEDKSYSLKQMEIFSSFIEKLEALSAKKIPLKHLANSAAILDLPQSHFDAVRAGIILYGLEPSDQTSFKNYAFQPVMTLKARLSRVERIEKGSLISYGGSYQTAEDKILATVPAGYADGYSRLLNGKGQVVFQGKKLDIVGKICMDQFMIDISEFPEAKKGQEIILLGQGQTAEDLARKLGTINYEVTCMISSRVPRIIKEPEKRF